MKHALFMIAALCVSTRAAAAPRELLFAELAFGKVDTELVIGTLGADGKETVLHTEKHPDEAPFQMVWADARTLVVHQSKDGGDILRWFVDGKLAATRTETILGSTWPSAVRGVQATRMVVTKSGQVWLARGTHFMRIDAKPHTTTTTAPADIDPLRDQRWTSRVESADLFARQLALYPKLKAPAGLTVTKSKTKIGGVTFKAFACTAKGAKSTFPSRATHEFSRMMVAELRFVSPTLPLFIATGAIPGYPDGEYVENEFFLGCTKEPLSEVDWLGDDRWITRAPGEKARYIVWDAGKQVAKLSRPGYQLLVAPR